MPRCVRMWVAKPREVENVRGGWQIWHVGWAPPGGTGGAPCCTPADVVAGAVRCEARVKGRRGGLLSGVAWPGVRGCARRLGNGPSGFVVEFGASYLRLPGRKPDSRLGFLAPVPSTFVSGSRKNVKRRVVTCVGCTLPEPLPRCCGDSQLRC